MAMQGHGLIPVEAIQLPNRPLLVLPRDVTGGVEQRLKCRYKGRVDRWRNQNTLFTGRWASQLNQTLAGLHERGGGVRVYAQDANDVVSILVRKQRGVGVNLLSNLS